MKWLYKLILRLLKAEKQVQAYERELQELLLMFYDSDRLMLESNNENINWLYEKIKDLQKRVKELEEIKQKYESENSNDKTQSNGDSGRPPGE